LSKFDEMLSQNLTDFTKISMTGDGMANVSPMYGQPSNIDFLDAVMLLKYTCFYQSFSFCFIFI